MESKDKKGRKSKMLIHAQLHKMHKKPDQQSYDFTQNDFTKDDSYHDLDLSAIVPAGAKAVLIWGSFKSDTGGTEINWAQNEHSGTYLKVMRHQPVADIAQEFDCIIPLDSLRVIQYRIESAPTYVNINMSVVAWWT